MSRPLNKSQLLEAANKQYTILDNYLDSLSEEQFTFTPAPGAWAVKDIIAHLYEWQQMFFTWYEGGQRSEQPAVPAPGFKWNQLPALNQAIYEKHQHLSTAQALEMFHTSHKKTMAFIENLPEQDLLQPGLYPWMNRNTLLSYLNSTTAAHYLWAVKDAKKVLSQQDRSG